MEVKPLDITVLIGLINMKIQNLQNIEEYISSICILNNKLKKKSRAE